MNASSSPFESVLVEPSWQGSFEERLNTKQTQTNLSLPPILPPDLENLLRPYYTSMDGHGSCCAAADISIVKEIDFDNLDLLPELDEGDTGPLESATPNSGSNPGPDSGQNNIKDSEGTAEEGRT